VYNLFVFSYDNGKKFLSYKYMKISHKKKEDRSPLSHYWY